MASLNKHFADDNLMVLDSVSMQFGSLFALVGLSFGIQRGEILGVAGPNGAGKSTLLNVCTGGLSATSGKILFKERNITGAKRHTCCGLGIGRTFQMPTVLTSLSVGENILAGHIFGSEVKKQRPAISLSDVIELTALTSLLDQKAGQADLLTRKRIMLGSTLATGPEIIFMDEPLGGLNGEENESFCNLIEHIRNELGITFVVVEHKTRALARVSDRILIINFGQFVCIDTPKVVLNDDHVVEIYLGKKHNA